MLSFSFRLFRWRGVTSLPYPLRGIANLKRRVGHYSILCVLKGGASSSLLYHAIEMGGCVVILSYSIEGAFFKGRGRDTS